jgi:hypothetical protein
MNVTLLVFGGLFWLLLAFRLGQVSKTKTDDRKDRR